MPQIPCADQISDCVCVDSESPFRNFSSELADLPSFFSIGYGRPPLPLGTNFGRLGCSTLCENETSQEAADLCAVAQAYLCVTGTWKNNGGGFPRPPVPPPQNPGGQTRYRTFFNSSQTATVFCPDGLPFTFTVPAGRFVGNNQLDANTKARTYALQKANQTRLCLSSIATRACAGTTFNAIITASGAFSGSDNFWAITSGAIPPGLTIVANGTQAQLSGIPTTTGLYQFTITVTDALGDTMSKPYTLGVVGILNNNPFPNGQTMVAYSQFISSAGVVNPIYSLESGALPDGLTLDPTGVIFGTPTVAATFNFVLGVTEAGTGITCNSPSEITIDGLTQCTQTPTNSVTHNDTVGFYNSLAIVPNDKYLLACEGFTPSMELFDVSGGTIVSVTTQTPNFSFGRVVWSPLANEWVHVGQDAGTQTQVWFTSYNKTTLVQTGQDQSVNILGSNTFQQWGIVCSASTGIVYAACGNNGSIRTYNSITHLVGPTAGFVNACLGSLGLNESSNRLYVANGANDSTGAANKSAVVTVYNAATLALVATFNLPINGISHGYVRGCTFNPDDGFLYVAGNDEGGDGGDVFWVLNPVTGATVNTIRLLTSGLKTLAANGLPYPTTLTYDSSTHQIYMFFGENQPVPTLTRGGVQIICCDSQTKVALLTPSSDPAFGIFLGDVVFGTVEPGTVDNVFLADSFNGLIRGYTFP